MTILATLGLLICLSVPVATIAQARPFGSELRQRPIASFEARELNMVDALLQLGQEQQVPIGIEYIDADAPNDTRRSCRTGCHLSEVECLVPE